MSSEHMAGTGRLTLDEIPAVFKSMEDHRQGDVQPIYYATSFEYAQFQERGLIDSDGKIDLPVYGKVSVEVTKPLPKLRCKRGTRR